ncbi:MAG: PAS domain S-box protein, partial [Rhodocyclaceae bacterium]
MKASSLQILVIEDERSDFALLERYLRQHGLGAECRQVDSDAALASALEGTWDVALTDRNVPGMDLPVTLGHIRARDADLPVILVSGTIGETTAVELLHLGLADFILKDNLTRLPSAIHRAIEQAAERRARRAAEAALRAAQAAALEEQRQGRLAALNLMEDAQAARARAEAAHAALLDSEAKYRLLAENAADWIFWVGPDGGHRYVSPACEALSGYAPEAFLADPGLLISIVHPEDRAAYMAHLADNNLADEAEMEIRIVHARGGIRWIGHRCRPIFDQSGKFAGRHGSNRDITARHHADDRLREREARYRDMFAANPHPMWVYDADSLAFLDVNDAAVAKYGYAREEFLAMTIRDIRPSEDVPRLIAAAAGAASGTPVTGVWRHRSKGGTEILMEITAHGVEFAGRRAMVVLANDVTQRVRAEEQLRKLSLAVEQSPECIFITDTSGRIEYVNEAFVRVSGYGREDVLGRNPRLLQSGYTPRENYGALWHALALGGTWEGEFNNRRKDGSDYVAYAILTPLRDAAGRITHYVAIEEDITEKKRNSEELERHRHHLEELVERRTAELSEARARADAANEAKSTFLASMSHEIRTPMNAIVGLTHLLQQSVVTAEQRERLGKIDGAARHLLSVINDILDLSKIEAGRLE